MDPEVYLVSSFMVVCLLAILIPIEGASSERCKFPREWKGRWHQDGLGDVTMKTYSLSRGGDRMLCADHRRDYFLLEDRNRECFQCFLMMERHVNLIQYKQSYCVPRDSLQSICHGITVEANLFTLVRDPHIPTPCPFNEAYYFKYSDGMNDFCPTALSFAQPCAGATRYMFSFQHCNSEASLNQKDADLACIASWKDGSDLYMYGRFASSDLNYRCFMYRSYGDIVYLSMSADATCYGLRSYEDGPFTMQLKRDEFGWPSPLCEFADWFTSTNWRDLSGKNTLHSDESGGVITMDYKKRKDARSFVKAEFRCTNLLHQNTSVMVASSFTTLNCLSKQQCVMFNTLTSDLVEMYMGPLRQEVTTCSLDPADYDDTQFLYPSDSIQQVQCPYMGRYSVTSSTIECSRGNIGIGCNESHSLHINCGDDEDGIKLDCMKTWEDDGVSYVIARDREDASSISCLTMHQSSSGLVMSTENSCNVKFGKNQAERFVITMPSRSDNCESDFLGYDASGDVMRDPAVNFQDASNAHAPPTNSAVGHHYSNPILTANGMVALVVMYTYLAAVR